MDIERERHGVSHAEICGHLLAVWGLPADVATAAASAWYQPTTFGARPDLAAAVQIGRISAAARWSSAAHQATELDAATQQLLAAGDDIGRAA